MPAYEMLLDKHDSKRILLYLSRLDPETGLDPNPEDYEPAEETGDEDTDTNDIGTKTPNKNLPPRPGIPRLKENIEITPTTEEKK